MSTPSTSSTDEDRVKIHLGWKLSALAVSLFFIGLGLLAIIEKQHVGTTRYSPTPVVLQGSSAEAMGWALIVMGTLPLIVWVSSRIWVSRLAVVWFFAMMAVIFIPLVLMRHPL